MATATGGIIVGTRARFVCIAALAVPTPVGCDCRAPNDGSTRGEKAGFRGQVDVGVRQTRWIVKRLTTLGVVAIVSEWTQPRAFLYSPVPPVIALSKGPWSR